MQKKLEVLVEKYKKELHYRDLGYAAKRTYLKIKKIAKPKELVKILEKIHNLKP